MSDLQVEYLPLAGLIPYARNARTHDDRQVAQIAASIREFGFTNPILVDPDNGIIAGHGRALAAAKLSLERVPCIRLGHLTETQRRAYVLADNRIALNSGWDEEMLILEIRDLEALDVNIAALGFDPDELAKMVLDANADAVPAKEAEVPPEEFLVVVRCNGEKEQQSVFEELTERGLDCKIMS